MTARTSVERKLHEVPALTGTLWQVFVTDSYLAKYQEKLQEQHRPWSQSDESECYMASLDELLPARSIAHVDRGIRVEHKAALLLLFIEIERHTGILRLGVAESCAMDLRFHLHQEL